MSSCGALYFPRLGSPRESLPALEQVLVPPLASHLDRFMSTTEKSLVRHTSQRANQLTLVTTLALPLQSQLILSQICRTKTDDDCPQMRTLPTMAASAPSSDDGSRQSSLPWHLRIWLDLSPWQAVPPSSLFHIVEPLSLDWDQGRPPCCRTDRNEESPLLVSQSSCASLLTFPEGFSSPGRR